MPQLKITFFTTHFQIVGLDKIPPSSGAMLVYYHGAIPLDYIFVVGEILLRRGRQATSVVDRFMLWMPFFRMMQEFGCFAGTREVRANSVQVKVLSFIK